MVTSGKIGGLWRRLARAPEAVAGPSGSASSWKCELPRAARRALRRCRSRAGALPRGHFDRAGEPLHVHLDDDARWSRARREAGQPPRRDAVEECCEVERGDRQRPLLLCANTRHPVGGAEAPLVIAPPAVDLWVVVGPCSVTCWCIVQLQGCGFESWRLGASTLG